MRLNLNMLADASLTTIGKITRRDNADIWEATSFVYGTFGGGTVTLFVSPDGGTTKVALKDWVSGTAVSVATTAAMNFLRLGNGSTNSDQLILYATLSGSTNPNLNITIFDNRA